VFCLPIFFAFVATHGFAMLYALPPILADGERVQATVQDVKAAHGEIA